jgi:hypothetical protein
VNARNFKRRLAERLRKARGELVRSIESDDDDEELLECLIAHLKALRDAETLIKRRNVIADSLAFFLIAASILIIAAQFHLPSTPLTLVLESRALSFSTSHLEAQAINFRSAVLSQSSAAALRLKAVDSGKLASVSLRQLSVENGSRMTLLRTKDCLTISIDEGALNGTVWVDSPSPQSFPLSLSARSPNKDFNLCGQIEGTPSLLFKAASVSVFEKIPFGMQDNMILPAILSGRVKVGSESFIPSRFDILQVTLDQKSLSNGYVTFDSDGALQIGVDARATDVRLGLEGSEVSLMPTLLRYLSTDHSLSVFFSSIVFLVSLAWKIRSSLID